MKTTCGKTPLDPEFNNAHLLAIPNITRTITTIWIWTMIVPFPAESRIVAGFHVGFVARVRCDESLRGYQDSSRNRY